MIRPKRIHLPLRMGVRLSLFTLFLWSVWGGIMSNSITIDISENGVGISSKEMQKRFDS